MTVSRLEGRLRRLEEKAGGVDDVEAILRSINLSHVDALLLQTIAIIGHSIGELDNSVPTDAMLRTSIYSRQKYDEAIAQIPPGTCDRLIGAFIAKAGDQDLLDEVLACRRLHLRRNKFTQLFPDQDIMSAPVDGIVVAVATR